MWGAQKILLLSKPEVRIWISISMMATLMVIEAEGDREREKLRRPKEPRQLQLTWGVRKHI